MIVLDDFVIKNEGELATFVKIRNKIECFV